MSDPRARDSENQNASSRPRPPYGGSTPPWRLPPGFVPLGAVPHANAAGRDASGPGELASWGSRVGALIIDSIVVGVPGLIVKAMLATAGAGSLATVVVAAAGLLYFAALDGRSQTIGKRMVGIAVRDERSGKSIGPARAAARWLIYSLLWYGLFVPGVINALSPLWDRRNKAWHDHAMRSVVVRTDEEGTL